MSVLIFISPSPGKNPFLTCGSRDINTNTCKKFTGTPSTAFEEIMAHRTNQLWQLARHTSGVMEEGEKEEHLKVRT